MVLLAAAAPFVMNDGVSEAADDDSAQTRRLEQIDERVRQEMRRILAEVRSGEFAHEWMAECRSALVGSADPTYRLTA